MEKIPVEIESRVRKIRAIGLAIILGTAISPPVQAMYQLEEPSGTAQSPTTSEPETLKIPPRESLPTAPSNSVNSYGTDRIIVKYKETVTECAHCMFALKHKSAEVTQDQSDSLDQLHQRFGVTR